MARRLKPKSMVGRTPVKAVPDPETDNAKAKSGSGTPVTIMRCGYKTELEWRQTITMAQGHGRVVVAIDSGGHLITDFEAYDAGVRPPPQEPPVMPPLSRSPFAEAEPHAPEPVSVKDNVLYL